jgi:polyferredoxin
MNHQRVPYFTRLRFATGIIATGIMNLNVFGWSLRSVCAPGFNCHGCPWATAACPIGALTYGSALRSVPVLAIASILAVGAVLGRLVCGFFCPFGLLQDLLHRIPSRKIKLPRWVRWGKYATLLLFVIVFPWLLGFEQSGSLMFAPAVTKASDNKLDVTINVTNAGMAPINGVHLKVRFLKSGTSNETFHADKDYPDLVLAPGQTAALPHFLIPDQWDTSSLVIDSPQSVINQSPRYQLYFCKLCPAGTLTATLPHLFLRAGDQGWAAWVSGLVLRLAILAVILVLMIVASRPFCRMFCPLGAIYAFTAPAALTRLQINADACTRCGDCNHACPMELNVIKEIGGMECIACGDCKKACPQHGIHRVFSLGIKV